MNILTMLLLGLGALLGLFLSSRAVDPVIAAHGWLLVAFCAGFIIWMLRRNGDTGGPANPNSKINYNDAIVRAGVIFSVFWGVVGFLVGLVIALQLAFPVLNLDLPWTSFGRLRPLHTSAVIFAFGGNVLISTSLYVVQRTCQTRVAGGWAPWFVVLGYNLFIVIAASGYVFGVTQSKEYAEANKQEMRRRMAAFSDCC